MMLSTEKIEKYKIKLEAQKTELMQKVNAKENPQDFGSDVDGFEEEGEEGEEFSNQIAISQALKNRVNEIDSALNRIEMGTYGLCEKCNKPVSEKMLNVIAETRLCENCKRGA